MALIESPQIRSLKFPVALSILLELHPGAATATRMQNRG